jgi:hypothetical protein
VHSLLSLIFQIERFRLKDKSWEVVILGNFVESQKVELTHPLMAEIDKQFTGK